MLNGLSGIVWGPIQAHIHFKYNIYAILLINTLCAFLYPSLSYSKAFYFILTCLSNFCYGGYYSIKYYLFIFSSIFVLILKRRDICSTPNRCSRSIRENIRDENAWYFLLRHDSCKSVFILSIGTCQQLECSFLHSRWM